MHTYYELRLPQQPLKEEGMVEDLKKRKLTENNSYIHIVDNADMIEFLNPELLECFASINCPVEFGVLFGTNNARTTTCAIHRDIFWEYKIARWLPVNYGISYELTPGDTIFHWTTTGNLPEVYPDPSASAKRFNSVTYGDRRFNDEHLDQCNIIDKYKFRSGVPILVKTDIPHFISYKTTDNMRVGLSLRFKNFRKASYEQAVEQFKPFII